MTPEIIFFIVNGMSDKPKSKDLKNSNPIVAKSPQDMMSQYIEEVSRYPLLTPDEEKEIAKEYFETKDPKLAEKLVTSNLRFVIKIATEYSKFGGKLIDLVQEGNIGLMQAVKEYNPYKGARIITYAVWWIRGYIQDYLMRQHSMVRIGTNSKDRKLFYRLEKEKQKLIRAGESPTPKLLSERLDVKEKDITQMQGRLSSRDLSLDQSISGDSSTKILDFQEDESLNLADESLMHFETLENLTETINELKPELNPKEILLLEKRLLSDEPVTLKSLGDIWGVTREAARQTEARLIKKIKTKFLDKTNQN